jgi:DNA replicative helicase MCM subunit Mcm2 (Cdc46/Mcm family)
VLAPKVRKMTHVQDHTFTCKDCGQEMTWLTDPPPNTPKDICLTCAWIRENKNLTEEEKDILRGKFRIVKTHGPE